jgi:hypothetical protein
VLGTIDADVMAIARAAAAVGLERVRARLFFDGAQTCRVVVVVVVAALRLDHLLLNGVLVPRQDDRLGLGLAFGILVVLVAICG